jgi:antirestriction protein
MTDLELTHRDMIIEELTSDFGAVAEDLFDAYEEAFGQGYATDAETIMDAYYGQYVSELEFAYDMVENTMQIPAEIEPYFDYEKYARDLFITNYIFENGFVFFR